MSKSHKLNGMLRKYINGFAEHVINNGLAIINRGELEPPRRSAWKLDFLNDKIEPLSIGPADCKFCESDNGVQHLLHHMADRNYVPTLLWQAIKETGHINPAFVWNSIGSASKHKDICTLKSVLSRYFNRRKAVMLELLE